MIGESIIQPNVRTVAYKEMLARLPKHVQSLAHGAFQLFLTDPLHPLLRVHELKKDHRGQHRDNSVSVSITMAYRAIYIRDGEQNIWYWIGSHADYNNFTGNR